MSWNILNIFEGSSNQAITIGAEGFGSDILDIANKLLISKLINLIKSYGESYSWHLNMKAFKKLTARLRQLKPPPVAQIIPSAFNKHNISVEDPFFWMQSRETDLACYLKCENQLVELCLELTFNRFYEEIMMEFSAKHPFVDSELRKLFQVQDDSSTL
jgi:hypothetical protein